VPDPGVALSDGVVTLRPWAAGDAAFMVEAFRDPAIRRYNGPVDERGRLGPPMTVADAEAAIDGFTASWAALAAGGSAAGVAFVIVDEASGRRVGCCGVDGWSADGVAQFGYWVVPAGRGRGCATRAAVLMTGWLFGLGAGEVFVTVVADNEASAAVARRAGFVADGTTGTDAVWRGRRLDVLRFVARAAEWAPGAVSGGRPGDRRG
jgi:RimJ/RimL family protein N-acetyltransferase